VAGQSGDEQRATVLSDFPTSLPWPTPIWTFAGLIRAPLARLPEARVSARSWFELVPLNMSLIGAVATGYDVVVIAIIAAVRGASKWLSRFRNEPGYSQRHR